MLLQKYQIRVYILWMVVEGNGMGKEKEESEAQIKSTPHLD